MMIRFSLHCVRGHEFESWFQSGAVFDAQAKAGLIVCPHCQATEVSKAIMAPAVASRASKGPAESAPKMKSQTAVALLNRRDRQTRAMIDAFRKHVFETAQDVGTRFAEEARRIHDGLVPERAIHGQAKYEDARALVEDGVTVVPIPPALDDFN
jgi:hypothetical protein